MLKNKYIKGLTVVLAFIGAGVVVFAAILVFAPGKAIEEIKRGCKSTELSLSPVSEAELTQPKTYEAKLTADGKPVTGAPITFFVIGNGPNKWTSLSIGGADTDTNGVGRLSLKGGLKDQVPSDHQVTGYRAEYRIVGSGEYCRTAGESTI